MRRSRFLGWIRATGILLLLFVPGSSRALDTFSICAVDTTTGEVGSAGASCIEGAIVISDVHPGVGVIHTQALWIAGNQDYASTLMDSGFSPQEIIDRVLLKDLPRNRGDRQYGAVDLVEGGRSAAFTGENCYDYKGHRLGPTYAVQGNILAGAEVLDSMEVRFLRTEGSLADKLMAAMQGAKIPGADWRCESRGTSSISAFLRVAQPADTDGVLYLDLNVPDTESDVEPIDSLQVLYDEWKSNLGTEHPPAVFVPHEFRLYPSYPNPFNPSTSVTVTLPEAGDLTLAVYDVLGRHVATLARRHFAAGTHEFTLNGSGMTSGVYFVRARAYGNEQQVRRIVLMK